MNIALVIGFALYLLIGVVTTSLTYLFLDRLTVGRMGFEYDSLGHEFKSIFGSVDGLISLLFILLWPVLLLVSIGLGLEYLNSRHQEKPKNKPKRFSHPDGSLEIIEE